jgi:hypothetical protein
MDFEKITNPEWEGIDHRDYPDYCDAFCTYAEIDGEPLTDEQLDELNDSDFRYELLIETMN